MLVQCVLFLVISVSRLFCEDGITDQDTGDFIKDSSKENISPHGTNEDVPLQATPEDAQCTAQSDSTLSPERVQPLGEVTRSTLRGNRRRPRRFRTYFNDDRYRNRANNPYNSNSYYAFQRRPAQQPVVQNQYYDPRYRDAYNNQYYDPYRHGYYGYPGYSHPAYYSYPYQPQPAIPQPPLPPMPPTPPPTEVIPDLYYVRDSPNGQYQYKKVSVAQEGQDVRRGLRGTRWPRAPQQLQPGNFKSQDYYGYSYNDYNRRPQSQPYYPQSGYPYPQSPQQPSAFQQQMQWAQQYSYPRMPAGNSYRSRVRSGVSQIRPTAMYSSWRLTVSPSDTYIPTQVSIAESPPGEDMEAEISTEQAILASGD